MPLPGQGGRAEPMDGSATPTHESDSGPWRPSTGSGIPAAHGTSATGLLECKQGPSRGPGGSISRILSRDVIPLGTASLRNSSDLPAGSAEPTYVPFGTHQPIWSCSVGGLPCPSRCRSGGGLLPHRFTLACAFRPSAVCSLLHFPSGHPAQALPGPLLYGVRTFLCGEPQRHPDPHPMLTRPKAV